MFDISQTNCPIEDYPKLLSIGYDSKDHAKAYDQLVEFAENFLNCSVSSSKMPLSLRGTYSPCLNEIMINNNLIDTEKLSTLCHELGHAILHNQNSELKSRTQQEIEADMFGIMLQNHFNIELTNLRKLHFKQHYERFEKEFKQDGKSIITVKNAKINFNEVIDNVFKKFGVCMKELEKISKGKELEKEN